LKEEKNSPIFLRPRFSLEVAEKDTVVLKRIQEALSETKKKYKSKQVDYHLFIDVPDSEAHFWSPQLHIEIEEMSDKSSLVKGLFGPKPQVWTLFMFIHFVVGGTFLAFGVMFYVKYSLGESVVFPAVMLITLPIVWVLLYVFGRLGRDTGKKQMKSMHDFLISVLPLDD
jgi:Na+/melibiose symporter-like transporter